jgi:hypothetical protein
VSASSGSKRLDLAAWEDGGEPSPVGCRHRSRFGWPCLYHCMEAARCIAPRAQKHALLLRLFSLLVARSAFLWPCPKRRGGQSSIWATWPNVPLALRPKWTILVREGEPPTELPASTQGLRRAAFADYRTGATRPCACRCAAFGWLDPSRGRPTPPRFAEPSREAGDWAAQIDLLGGDRDGAGLQRWHRIL